MATNLQWVLLLHGLGGDKNTMLPVGRRLARDCPTIRYETLEGNFFSLYEGERKRGWFAAPSDNDRRVDIEGRSAPTHLDVSLKRVHLTLARAIEGGCSPNQIYLVGHSQGAALAIAAGMTFPQTLGGVATIAGYLPLPNGDPVPDVETPFFLQHVRQDPVVTVQWAGYAQEQLRGRGFQCHIKIEDQPTTPHGIHPRQVQEIAAWIKSQSA